ncbi:uncharacterized protein [Acropora muricata]|uniref:uncharacterized protein isoform X2 n=1 Tax=Acropora muricata TaxID=159855 RepID=UPI0034E3FD3C
MMAVVSNEKSADKNVLGRRAPGNETQYREGTMMKQRINRLKQGRRISKEFEDIHTNRRRWQRQVPRVIARVDHIVERKYSNALQS